MRWLGYIYLIPMALGVMTWWVVGALALVFAAGLGVGAWLW